MSKTKSPKSPNFNKISGTELVLLAPHSLVDPTKLHEATTDQFTLACMTALDEKGILKGYFAESGYVLVGQAEVVITFNSHEDNLKAAVSSIETQQESLRATAQNEITKLEKKKQELLAIAYQVDANSDQGFN